MDYRNLGKTGLKVSPLCLGTMQFGWTADEATSLQVLEAAFDRGINFIDTADVYSNWAEGNPGGVAEQIIGRWLRSNQVPRDQVVIATKVRGRMGPGPNDQGLSRFHILDAVEASLRRLGCGHIDLYQLHSPDDQTPIEETLEALDILAGRGDVRYIGCSNFEAWRLVDALWASDRLNLERMVCLQPHYNLVHRAEYEQELEAVCQRYGLGVIPYSPLAGGFLTGKYIRGEAPTQGTRGAMSSRLQRYFANDQCWQTLQEAQRIAASHDKTASQIALSWLLAKPTVTSPIIGPRSLRQLEDNLGSLEVSLDPAEVEALDVVSRWDQ